MKYTHFLAALLVFGILLSLTACAGTPNANTESAQTAAEEITVQDAAYYADRSGLVIRQWTQAFQPYADSLLIQSVPLDPVVGDYILTLLGWYLENPNDPDASVSLDLAAIVSSSNPSVTRDAALTKLTEILGEQANADWETFTTDAGQTLWVKRYSRDGGPRISGTPTPEQREGLTAMYLGLDQQLAQIEMVKPKLNDASKKVSFSTVDLDGNPVDSAVFANAEYTMINVWASYCASCVGEMTELMQMDAELENVQIITILADALSPEDEAAEDARQIVQKLNMTLPVYLINAEIYGQFPCRYVPTSFLVDREGNPVGASCAGAVGVDSYRAWIQSCIEAQ